MYTCISQSSRIISGIILLILIGIIRPLVMNSFNIKFSYDKNRSGTQDYLEPFLRDELRNQYFSKQEIHEPFNIKRIVQARGFSRNP